MENKKTHSLVSSGDDRFYCFDDDNDNNEKITIITIKYIVCFPQAMCQCGCLIINASVEAYRACQVYESSLSSQPSQSDSHSALNIKC